MAEAAIIERNLHLRKRSASQRKSRNRIVKNRLILKRQ